MTNPFLHDYSPGPRRTTSSHSDSGGPKPVTISTEYQTKNQRKNQRKAENQKAQKAAQATELQARRKEHDKLLEQARIEEQYKRPSSKGRNLRKGRTPNVEAGEKMTFEW